MVKGWLGLVLLVAAANAQADRSYGDSKLPGRAQHWTVVPNSVAITRSGQWQPDRYGTDTPTRCARFRPTPTEVQHWFGRARIVDRSYWHEQTEWTQCSADGTVVSGGRRYPWHLDQSGRGNVSRAGTEDIYLSGPELPFRPGRD